MATRKIIHLGNDLLRKISKPVEKFDDGLWEILDDMADTMYKEEGMGLAAPQIGVLRRIVIIECNGAFLEFINPVITAREGEQIGNEGCLSVLGLNKDVKRPSRITVEAMDRYGENFTLTCENLFARCICHEVDHLNGILFVDIAEKDEVKN